MDIDASSVLERLSAQASSALRPFFDEFAALYDQKYTALFYHYKDCGTS